MGNRVETNRRVVAASLTLAIAVLLVDISIPLGVAGGVPYVAVVLVSLQSPRSGVTVFVALLCSVLTAIGYFYSPDGGELWQVFINRLLALFAIWVTAVLGLSMKRAEEGRGKIVNELRTALENIKTLKGLLPICASCKKIRDDRGRWIQMEKYVHERTEADFTHGLCPGCAEKFRAGGGGEE
ncbi:MAG: hypothetical protein V3W31_05300 [Thermodesulfobacteriota bacterium]